MNTVHAVDREYDPIKLAWAAGLIEGEGAFCLTTSGRQMQDGKRSIGTYVRVVMIDEDTIQRVRDVFGVGQLGMYHHSHRLGKLPLYYWHVANRKDVANVINAVYPFLSRRRRTQAARVTDAIRNNPPISSAEKARRSWVTKRLKYDARDVEICKLVKAGLTHKEVAKRFGITRGTVTQIMSRHRHKVTRN